MLWIAVNTLALYVIVRDGLSRRPLHPRRDPLRFTQPIPADLHLALAVYFLICALVNLRAHHQLQAIAATVAAIVEWRDWWKGSGRRRWKTLTSWVRNAATVSSSNPCTPDLQALLVPGLPAPCTTCPPAVTSPATPPSAPSSRPPGRT